MASKAELVQVGDSQLLIEVERASGSQQVSIAGDAAKKVINAFSEVEAAVAAVGTRVAEMGKDLATRAAQPSELKVEFGLKVSAEGNVIVAAVGAEATLKVTITYPGPKTGASN